MSNIVSRRALSTSRCLWNEASSSSPLIQKLSSSFKKQTPRSESNDASFLTNTLEAIQTPEINKTQISNRFTKKFSIGDTYDPFDFSIAKLHLDQKQAQESKNSDSLISKNINPLNFYTNSRYLSKFLSSTGKILHRDVTKLSQKNQKRITVAIKRSINAGLLSTTHKDVHYITHRHGG